MSDPIEPLRARYGGHTWIPIGIGHSDAKVWRLEGPDVLFLKAVPPTEIAALTNEAKALEWLAAYDSALPPSLRRAPPTTGDSS